MPRDDNALQGVEQALAKAVPQAVESQLKTQLSKAVAKNLDDAVAKGLGGPAVRHSVGLCRLEAVYGAGERSLQRVLREAAHTIFREFGPGAFSVQVLYSAW